MNNDSAKDSSAKDSSVQDNSAKGSSVRASTTKDRSTAGSVITLRTTSLMARITPAVALSTAGLMLFAAAAIGVTKSRSYYAEADRADQGAAALAAGRQLAVNFVTMDYRKFDSYSLQVLSGASGSFHADYAAKLADLKKVMVANHAISSVKQAEAGLVSSDGDSAEVIVGVVAPTSNTATPQAIDKTYRLRLNLQRTSDTNTPWKVINLVFVG